MDETLYEKLLDVIVDILRCKDELSKHNQKGHYSFDMDGRKLKIDFEWTRGNK